jgi:hypothetical protein
MSDHPAMSENEVAEIAWSLEAKMQEIRRDPHAALTAELEKVRAAMLAEYKADMAKRKADLAKHNAEREAKFDAKLAALWTTKIQAFEARFEALMAEVPEELRAALVDGLRLRKAVADSLRDEKVTT